MEEAKYRNFLKNYGFTNFTEYQFIVNTKKYETILNVILTIQKNNDYAFISIQPLFMNDNIQINSFFK